MIEFGSKGTKATARVDVGLKVPKPSYQFDFELGDDREAYAILLAAQFNKAHRDYIEGQVAPWRDRAWAAESEARRLRTRIRKLRAQIKELKPKKKKK